MAAVSPIEGGDAFAQTENSTHAGTAPAAGPTPTPVAASERVRQHVPWAIEKDNAKDDPEGEARQESSVTSEDSGQGAEKARDISSKRSGSSDERSPHAVREGETASATSSAAKPSSSSADSTPTVNVGKREESKPESGVMSESERARERKKYRDAYMRPKRRAPDTADAPRPKAVRASSKPKTIHASELHKPRGALTGGKVGEFMGSHLEDGSSMVRGQNVTRLSYALYKIVRLFNLKKLIDYPAGAHVEWMPEMVTRFEYDVPGFFYQGVDTTEERLTVAREAGEAYGNADFAVANPEEELPVDSGDMLLVWNELDGERSDPRSAEYAAYIMRVVRAAKKANVAYVTFGQYPRLRGVAPIYSKGRWRFIGKSKEEPFLFNEHVRGVVPMASGSGGYHLHLTLFSLRSLTEEVLSM